MKINRPLINPTPEELDERLNTEAQWNNYSVPDSQLQFETDDKLKQFKQFWGSLKSRLKRRNDFLEVSPLWKHASIPFSIVTFLFNIFLFIYIIVFKFGDIGPRIPFFYNAVDQTWEQIDKSIILIFPIFLLAVFVIQIRLLIIVFRQDRRLTLTIGWILTFVNILLFITMSQIYYLIT